MRVTLIILLSTFLLLSLGCKSEKPKIEVKLPDKVEHITWGKVMPISPKALVDTLNSGAKLNLFFLQEVESDDPSYVVSLPGMRNLLIGDLFLMLDTISTKQPLYLVCLYGNDSRRMANEVIKKGIDAYYLDGGSYRLYTEMHKNNWTILPRPWESSTRK